MTTVLFILASLSGLASLFIFSAIIAAKRPLPEYHADLIASFREHQSQKANRPPGTLVRAPSH
jgi:hypothetical protein